MNYNTELQAYLESVEGLRAQNISTIGYPDPKYLENRLRRAWEIGFASGQRVAEEQTLQLLRKILFHPEQG